MRVHMYVYKPAYVHRGLLHAHTCMHAHIQIVIIFIAEVGSSRSDWLGTHRVASLALKS